jgi:signal transduction histidine kinase
MDVNAVASSTLPFRRWLDSSRMKPSRDGRALLLLGVLALLLALLAVLQYRWIGEVGRAEGERLRAGLESSARRFASSLDREVGRVLFTFLFEPRAPQGDARAHLLERLAVWRTQSEHPRLLSRITLLSPQGSGVPEAEACALDGDAFTPIALPATHEAVRQRLERPEGEPGRREGLPLELVIEDPLAVLVPMMEVTRGAEPLPRGAFRLRAIAVVELDTAYLRERLLPQLAETHFGPLAAGDYVVTVRRRRDGGVVYSSEPANAGELTHSDVQADLLTSPFFPGRPERGFERPGGFGLGGPEPEREGRPGGRGEPQPPVEGWRSGPIGPPQARGPWVLLVRHRGGSLAESVAAARRRNLAVGLGVLALLGAAAVLLALGGRRERQLAHQQLEFVAGVSHELNTPLAAIRSAGQNLADGIVSKPEAVQRYGRLIQRESDRLVALVSQVLDFAGIQSRARPYAREPVVVAEMLGAAVRDNGLVLSEAGLRVEFDVAPDLPAVRGDAPALQRAIENLLQNAAKFAASGGEVAVRAHRLPEGGVQIAVEDRGPGIPASELTRVFDPFFRGRAAQEHQVPGSGLGLSLVRHIVEGHAGRVRAQAREGGGSVFLIELAAGEGPG